MASETEQDRKLLPYLRMADEIQDHEPLVAYYCRSYALEKGMSISSKERTENTSLILASLVNQLEKDRKLIKLSPEDNLYVEAFASNILKKADEEYHAGRVDQNTSESFYAASIIFDIINQFGKLRPDIEEKLKYSVEKVANRKRAFKEGQRHVTLTTDTTTTSTHDLIQNASFSSTGLPSIDISSPYFDDRKELDIEQGSVVDVLIKWRNSHLKVKVNFDSDLVKDLGLKLLKLTKIKAETMKLLIPVPVGKGSKLVIPFSAEHSSLTLQEIAILEGKPIIMMGAFDDEIQEVSQSNSKKDSRIIGFDEEEKRLRQRSMGISQHSLRLPNGSYIFCDFKTLNIPGIELSPPASEALKRMHTLASDPGIIAIMNKHHWRVGVMTEMAPLGYVGVSPKCVLGYNKNFGEEISLRLRTDDLKGFRKYESIKKTLLHELAHMVYSEHDANFSLLDKQLNNEVSTLDWTKSRSHTLNGKHIYTHYNDEAYVKESYHISGQKLGGANLMPLSSARASAVVAAHNRYLSASTKTKEELQNAVQCIQEKDLDHLLNLLDDKGDNVWQNLMQRTAPNMIYQAWSNEPEVGPIMYRSRTVFEDATPEFVRDFFSDDEFRLQWDPMLTHFKILEESTRTGETVVHWIKKFPFFCSDREYIIGRRIWESGKTYYCVTKAVPYPALRKREKPRRVEQYFSSWRIKAVESLKQDGHLSACEVTLVHYEDMGIPKDIAKVGVRHGMWGTVKKLQSGMRSYELNRKSNAPLSRSALLAQTTTICSLDPACSDEQNSKKEVEIPIKDAGINWKWVALGGMVALLFGASRTIRKK